MRPEDKDIPDAEAIEAKAAAWLAERDDGLHPEKAAEFALWRSEDSRHQAAVERLEKTWEVLQQLRHFRPDAQAHPDRDLLAPARRRGMAIFPIVAWSMAAAAALALAGGGWWYLQARKSAPAQVYATTDGGYQRVALADGSVTELNTGSEVRVNYTPTERRVKLLRGEAHFTVAKNKQRPFWVEAGSVTVRAVGTAFDVRITDREIDVIVTEGKVTLAKNSGGSEGVSAPGAATAEPASLAAGQRATVALGDASFAPVIAPVTAEEIGDRLAWQGIRLVFVATPLAEAVGEFNRRNPVQIELADPSIGTLPISGSFRPENVEAFVRLLAQGGDIGIERPDSGRIILRKAR